MANFLRPNSTPRILSIQSHVVSGYCGNKSATFPLQLLEFEVDVLNTVQLSNHTQYEVTKGQIFTSKDLKKIHAGLKENNLLSLYNIVLSGYAADVSYLEAMSVLIKDIKTERKKWGVECWYTLDPVLGDDGIGYYVPNGELIADAYKKSLLPLADIVTPNRFEASILSGVEIDVTSSNVMDQVKKAIDFFHNKGIRMVVITSLALTSSPNELVCILSSRSIENIRGVPHKSDKFPGQDKKPRMWCIRVPKLDCPFTGTGDLFAALLSGWLQKTFDIKKSFENTANTIHKILEDTMAWYKGIKDGNVYDYELRLIQNKSIIMEPIIKFEAQEA